MGVPVKDFDDFRQKLRRVRKDSVIFGFLLYDSRESQRSVAEFARKQARWIDELARRTDIYFFFPLKKTKSPENRNPSPELMKAFKLDTARLPHVILFAPPRPDGTFRTQHAVYIPLAVKDFVRPDVYEPMLDELFGLIRECLAQGATSHETLLLIKQNIGKLRKAKTRRGLAAWLRAGARTTLFEVPAKLYGPFAEGFGKAVGEKMARG